MNNIVRSIVTTLVLATSILSPPGIATSFSTDQSDLWWNASESGWGIQFVQRGSAIFATMFVYDSAGKPIWYAATLEPVGGGSWSGDLYVTEGSSFAAPRFDASSVIPRKVGTMNWTAVFIESGQLFYSVDGVSVNKRLVRQLTRTDNFNGAFLGATHQQVVGCVNESSNRTIEMTGPIDIVQGSSTISVTAGGCVFSGRFSQAGQFGSLDGSYACGGGDVGTGRVYEMLVSIHHVSARFDTISTGIRGCQSSGNLAGIRRQQSNSGVAVVRREADRVEHGPAR